MSVKFNFESFDDRLGSEEYTLENANITPDSDIHFSYDGGRLDIIIDGREVFSTILAGNDFSVSVKGNG